MDRKIEELQKRIQELENKITQKEPEKKEKLQDFVKQETLHTWDSPSRVFVKRDKPWFLKVAVVALILILLAAFLQDFFVIIVISIIVLITYLLASIPPGNVHHEITNKGIISIGTLYEWDRLNEFWVSDKYGWKIVYIHTKRRIPARLVLLISRKEENTVVRLIGQYLPYKEFEEKQGWITRISDGIMVNPEHYTHLFKQKEETPFTQSRKEALVKELAKKAQKKK